MGHELGNGISAGPIARERAEGWMRPLDSSEAPEYYFKYIDLVAGDDIRSVLAAQQLEMQELFTAVSDRLSTHRYAPDKWSIRQVLGHVNDCERLFTFRAFWFARGFVSALPDFDQDVAAKFDGSKERPWISLVDEFQVIRGATLRLFEHLPRDAWFRQSSASGMSSRCALSRSSPPGT